MNEYSQKVREFFSRFFRTEGLCDTDDIIAGGYVNSLFAIQLVAWLEKEFAITIEDDDLHIANFSTVSAIAQLLERKLSGLVSA